MKNQSQLFKEKLAELSIQALEESDTPGDFDQEDLINALLVLQHAAHSIAFLRYNDIGFSMDRQIHLAIEFGRDLRRIITLFTGIDPADAVKGESWPEIVK